MSEQTLAEQVAALRFGDQVTATLEDGFGDRLTVTAVVREEFDGVLMVGNWELLDRNGEVGAALVSIDSHEPVFKVGDWVRWDSKDARGQVKSVGPHSGNPYYVALESGLFYWFAADQLSRADAPEPTFKVGDWVQVTGARQCPDGAYRVTDVAAALGPHGNVLVVDVPGHGNGYVFSSGVTRVETPAAEPVRPDEPTEFGSVVTARWAASHEVGPWVRTRGVWLSDDDRGVDWDDLHDVTVVRVGVGTGLTEDELGWLGAVAPLLREFFDRATGGAS